MLSLLTCAHLKLLGPCFKTGQMGDRLDTEWGTEQPTTDNKAIKAKCMHRTKTTLLPATDHEFTNPFQTAKPNRLPANQVSSKLVLFSTFQQRARPIRRTLYANAPLVNTSSPAQDFAEPKTNGMH
jgi:hypothetical protein